MTVTDLRTTALGMCLPELLLLRSMLEYLKAEELPGGGYDKPTTHFVNYLAWAEGYFKLSSLLEEEVFDHRIAGVVLLLDHSFRVAADTKNGLLKKFESLESVGNDNQEACEFYRAHYESTGTLISDLQTYLTVL